MRLAYLGTSEYAVDVLRTLAVSEFRPVIVISPPDRPRGRGRRVEAAPVAAAALELGIGLHRTESVNAPASLEALRAAEADLGLVCAFGQLIGSELLGELELLNVHPSLLPRWRGAAPIERAMISGDAVTGVTIMRVTEGLDSGPIALAEQTAIEAGENFTSLNARLAEIGGRLALDALRRHDAGGLELTEQDDAAATYAEKIDRSERRLNPDRPAVELERQVRALAERVGVYVELGDDERLGVTRATVAAADVAGAVKEGYAGSLADVEGSLVLVCASGSLSLDEVKPPGGRAMPASEYLRGHPLPPKP